MSDFIEVTKEDFFAFIKQHKGDPMPTTENPECSIWRTKHRDIVGKSYPGWKNPGDPKRYFVRSSQA